LALVAGLLVGPPLFAQFRRWRAEPNFNAAPSESHPAIPRAEKPADAARQRGPAIITQAQAQQIRTGMTYEECIRIIGCEGDPPASRMGGPPAGVYSEAYMWHFPGLDKTKTICFRDGRVVGSGTASSPSHNARVSAKWKNMPAGKGSHTSPFITMDTYTKIKTGMTYEECVKILGAEGVYVGAQPSAGGTYDPNGRPARLYLDTYTWTNPNDSTNATIQFRDGKVAARTFQMNSGPSGSSSLGGRGGR
jgi:hypothetical protein